MPYIPLEVIYHIAPRVTAVSILASLCSVSKSLNQFCTPLLYEKLCRWGKRLEYLVAIPDLPIQTHLATIRTLELGWRSSIKLRPLDTLRFIRYFSNMANLVSFCFKEFSSNNDDHHYILRYLPFFPKLSEFSFWDSRKLGPNTAFTPLPNLRNLTKLELLSLPRSTHSSVDDIAHILIASPNLKTFGLSLSVNDYPITNEYLHNLTETFSRLTNEISPTVGILRLENLHLGLGCLPQFSTGMGISLSGMIDISTLRHLRLDNDISREPNPSALRYKTINPNVFLAATRLESLHIQSLSEDIIQLIEILLSYREENDICLDKIEISRYFETVETEVEFFGGGWGYEQPVMGIGTHWRRISYGEIDNRESLYGREVLEKWVGECVGVEELCIPLQDCDMEYFEKVLLLRLTHLRQLIVMDLNSDRCSTEEKRLTIARCLFTANRRLRNEMRTDYENVGVLRYVGFASYKKNFGSGSHVYERRILPYCSDEGFDMVQGGEEANEWQIMRLEEDEIMKFDVLRRLAWEDEL